MALTVKVAAEYQIKGTKDIKCPKITIDITTTFLSEDPHDQAKYDYYNKTAQAWLDKNLTDRVKQFNDPIKDAQKKVDNMQKMIAELKKYLEDGKHWGKSVQLHKQLKDEEKHLVEFEKTANQLIKQAVASIEKIEAERWMQALEMKAQEVAVKKFKTAKNWKMAKLVAKVILVGLVVVTIAAVGIAASVLTMNPGPLALAAVVIGSVISGSTAIYKVAKLISDNWMNEERAMRKIEEDLVALGKVTEDVRKNRTVSLKKHLGELSGYRQARLKALKDTDAQIIAMEKEVVQLNRHLAEVIRDIPGSPTANAKQKTVNQYKALIAELKAQRKIVDNEDKAAQEIVNQAQGHLEDFERIGMMDIPSTPMKNKTQKLKDCFSSLGSLLKNSQDLAKALK